ncbi:unnamed protein product [Rhodiola kirilowii]
MYNEMDIQIHHLEQEAYCSVLRAFKAQADAISWEKESLITELRRELRVSDDEHRELLSRVNADDVIRRIREWRQSMGTQAAMLNPSQTMSNARRRQKIPSSVPSLSLGMQSAQFHSMNASQPPSSLDHGDVPGRRRKRSKPDFSSGTAGTRRIINPSHPLIGRRVMTRWPEDSNFYEASIIDYDPTQKRHLLVYDEDTPTETTEWVALDEIHPDDIRWVGQTPSEFVNGGGGLQGNVEGRENLNGPSAQQLPPTENGSGDKLPEYIELFDTETLITEVQRICNADNPNPAEYETARRMLAEQERALIDAIAILGRAIDADNEEEQRQLQEPQQQQPSPPGQQ